MVLHLKHIQITARERGLVVYIGPLLASLRTQADILGFM